MAVPTTYAHAEGAVYELVARGNKDAFFFQDFPDSKFIFDNRYEAQAAFSYEMRRVPPRTAAEFGRTVDFDLDLVGDVMRNPTFLIQLPTWLPPAPAQRNLKSQTSDLSGVTYGYTNGIAYFLFEQIQFYQDNILLQEFSGDTLWATALNKGTYASTFVTSSLTGSHDGSALSIGRNATPGLLRLELPLVGCQENGGPGFPQRACTRHTYRLRCKLRRLEDLVEASDGRNKPQPWGTAFQQIIDASGTTVTFQTIFREQITPLTLQLETLQVYLPRDAQTLFETTPQKVPFRRLFDNTFSQNRAQYLNVLAGGVSPVNRQLDGRHPTDRILWYFRSADATNANQLWKISTPSGTPFYNSVGLVIAGKDRELSRTPLIWRDITNFAKEELDPGVQLNTMNWTLGSIALHRFPDAHGQPTGAINMTTADRPTFYIDLANPQTQQPITQLFVITEGWAQMQTDGKGRAELFQMN